MSWWNWFCGAMGNYATIISTHISIRQTKLFYINLKHYSQPCSDDNFCNTTTCLRRPRLSPPKRIPIQSLLYKTATCLTQPATTFFVSQMKKSLSKTTTNKLYPTKKCKRKEQCIKNKRLYLFIFTLLLLFNAKFSVHKSWAI